MKYFLPTLFLALSPTLGCLAQDFQDPLEKRPPRFIVQTGIGLQLRGESQIFSTLSIETPLDDFWQVGIQGGHVFAKQTEYGISSGGDSYDKFLGGFEVGVFGKYFLHGQYSKRKSVFYCGGEIRLGTIRSEGQFFGGFFPAVYTHKTSQRTQKYLIRWGTQWRFGRYAMLELALPLGWQHSEFTHRNTVNGIESPIPSSQSGRFIMLPSLQLGFAF